MGQLKPLGDRVVVRPTETLPQTLGGIYLPDTAKEKPQTGEVLAVGQGRIGVDGNRESVGIEVGDTVLYTKYGGTEVVVDNEEVLILRESDILSIVN